MNGDSTYNDLNMSPGNLYQVTEADENVRIAGIALRNRAPNTGAFKGRHPLLGLNSIMSPSSLVLSRPH